MCQVGVCYDQMCGVVMVDWCNQLFGGQFFGDIDCSFQFVCGDCGGQVCVFGDCVGGERVYVVYVGYEICCIGGCGDY